MYRIGNEEIEALKKVVESRDLFKINGGVKASKNVEEKLRELFDVPYSIFMTSGHAALTSALVALGVGPGDEVIVPGYTYIATPMAVIAAGAMPVICEVDETLTIDPCDVEKKITKHTKAIIPVHIQGFPCDMDKICDIAKKYNLCIVEDACQADGGSYHGKRLGTIGDAGGLSFNYFKLITCGEGGGFLTKDKTVFERALIYHDSSAIAFFGDQMSGFSEAEFCGNEYRSNELCAAVLGVQLDRMDDILSDNRRNKKYMMEKLSDVCEFVPSNDMDGDCATTLAFRFDSEEKARKFASSEGIGGTVPADTGKHIYKNWTAVMNKRGAFNPLMDPFRMEANKDIVPDYKPDMCPKTLEYLSKTVYLCIFPDDTPEICDKRVEVIRKALSEI